MNRGGRMEGRVLFLGEEAALRFVLYHVFYKQPAPKFMYNSPRIYRECFESRDHNIEYPGNRQQTQGGSK